MNKKRTVGIVFAVLLMLSGIASAETITTTVVTLGGELSGITVSPNPATVAFEETQLFTASGHDAGGNPVPITPVWSSTDIGTIDEASGSFTARHDHGTGTVTATNGTIIGTASVTIPIVKSISVEETSVDFGAVMIGYTSESQSVTVNNTGNVDVTVTATPTDLTSGTDTIAASNVVPSGFDTLPDQDSITGSFNLTIPVGTPLGTYTGTIDITAS